MIGAISVAGNCLCSILKMKKWSDFNHNFEGQVAFIMKFMSPASNWLIHLKAWNKYISLVLISPCWLPSGVVGKNPAFLLSGVFIPIFDCTANENYFRVSPFSIFAVSSMWTKAKGKAYFLLDWWLFYTYPICLNSYFPSSFD